MAVVDQYTEQAGRHVYTSGLVNGTNGIVAISATIDSSNDDSANSVYRFAREIDSNLIPFGLKISNEAVASGTIDIGIFKVEKGAAIQADVLDKAVSIATAAKNTEGLKQITVGNQQKTLADLAGIDATKHPAVDLAVTVKGAGLAGKKLDITAMFIRA